MTSDRLMWCRMINKRCNTSQTYQTSKHTVKGKINTYLQKNSTSWHACSVNLICQDCNGPELTNADLCWRNGHLDLSAMVPTRWWMLPISKVTLWKLPRLSWRNGAYLFKSEPLLSMNRKTITIMHTIYGFWCIYNIYNSHISSVKSAH